MTRGVTNRTRADLLVLTRGLAPTRAKAQELLRRGRVVVGGVRVTRPGTLVDPDATIEVATSAGFVSRGGDKLAGLLDVIDVKVRGAVVVDVGASTGGFTDCVLRRGARKVYAVDVGHGQLDESLRADARVVVREGTNARGLEATDFDEPLDVALVDASFISLEKLAPALARILPSGARLIALVKPQFEVGKAIARRTRGVVRDPEERARAIDGARDSLAMAGFRVIAEADSVLPGPKGNVERFVVAERT